MREINIFCFGFGQVAKNFVSKFIAENIKVNLSVTSREKTNSKKYKDLDYKSYNFTENAYDQELLVDLKKAEYILVSIAPVNGTDIVVKNFQNIIDNSNTKWITYLSATSVYGNHNGEWVNEDSKTLPTSQNGIDRLYAEKSWLNLANTKNLSLQIFRLSGIYSNQYNVLSRLKSGEAKIISKKNHFFSRIHVEDIANILFISLSKIKKNEIYNISDDKPASSKEITLYGVKLLNVTKPEVIDADLLENGMLKNFYKDSKKVSNKKMKSFFNYKLKYPTYIEGLGHIKDNFV